MAPGFKCISRICFMTQNSSKSTWPVIVQYTCTPSQRMTDVSYTQQHAVFKPFVVIENTLYNLF